MARLGDVEISVIYTEKPVRSVKTTDHPVEGDGNIVDHIENQPLRVEITGVITGTDAAVKLRRLEYYMENGVAITYSCRNQVAGVIIENFPTVHDKTNLGGFNFTMTLKRIRRAQAMDIVNLRLPTKVAAQAKKVGNKGLQQKKKPSKMTPAQKAAANGNHVKGKGQPYSAATFRRLAGKGM